MPRRNNRRRLQPTPAPTPRPTTRLRGAQYKVAVQAMKKAVINEIKSNPDLNRQSKANITPSMRRYRANARYRANQRVEQSDNIITVPPCIVGKPKPKSFSEKVEALIHAPQVFKRQYQFTAENDTNGRKAWFGIDLSSLTYSGLYEDCITRQAQYYTNTSTTDSTLAFNAGDSRRFNIEYQSNKIDLMNSSTNSLTGNIWLFAVKRDLKGNYTSSGTATLRNVPINLMAYASSQNLNALTVAGSTTYEGTVGNGFNYDPSTLGYNYGGEFNMPGSSINSLGRTLLSDPSLSPMSPHVKDFVGHHWRLVEKTPISLKPGQQITKYFKFHELQNIVKTDADYEYIKGVAYYICIDMIGQTVGDSAVANRVSTGKCQLSVINTVKRVISVNSKIQSKITLMTQPLSAIPTAQEQIINADSGVQQTGYDEDDI